MGIENHTFLALIDTYRSASVKCLMPGLRGPVPFVVCATRQRYLQCCGS